MARKFESVKDISDAKDLWKISVKVKEKWTNVKDGKESIELLVVDEKVTCLFIDLCHMAYV
ncbi:replication A1-like protein [Trifolium pratense]|uniref:Replication A1-like protein n=1 Tax=Trifolium pratense TaxID=57577 RepID=A0A2K3KL21_TRIPR|nr:replication A1-like protein [Trifolium pratense]